MPKAALVRRADWPKESISQKILTIRGKQVLLDRDLALLYGVKAIALRQQVKRNPKRFPEDFMFQITDEEVDFQISQNVIPSVQSLGGFLPYAFTQEGLAMLSSVLNSERAIRTNIAIMRVFVRMREILETNQEFAIRMKRLEDAVDHHDSVINVLADEIDQMKAPVVDPRKRPIGFLLPPLEASQPSKNKLRPTARRRKVAR